MPPGPPPPELLPEPLSIFGIVREHNEPRKPSLLVKPLYWTPRHLELLGCSFRPVRYEELEHWPNYFDTLPDGGWGQAVKRRLGRLHLGQQFHSVGVVQCLLELYGIQPCDRRHASPTLPFRFDGCLAGQLPTELVFAPRVGSALPTVPTVAYLHLLRTLEYRLDALYRKVCMSAPWGAPLKEMARAQLLRLLPPDSLYEDPYVAATMLALAQAQRRAREQEVGGQEVEGQEVFQTHVLLFKATERDCRLCFFTAGISSAFLERFDQPSRFVPADPPVISYFNIPIPSVSPDATDQELARSLRAMDCAASAIYGSMAPAAEGNNRIRENLD